jgi:prepilin-type N-terminal cleavage/methylation domain-containing protein/prepilin-type processing-associated H-X9-DG protein
MHPASVPPRAGFTLIEVLVTLTIIAALLSIAVPVFTSMIDTKDQVIGKSNLRSIGLALKLYDRRFKRYPNTSSGLEFLVAPLECGILSLTEKTLRNTYVCPGDDVAGGVEDLVAAYRDLDDLDPGVISFAGRNTREYPLRRKHAEREVIACEAGGRAGTMVIHRHKINVLYLDGAVSDIDVLDIPGGEAAFAVGPASPVPMLRKLNKRP